MRRLRAIVNSQAANVPWRGSKVAEIAIPGVEGAISGSKTVQVEVKE